MVLCTRWLVTLALPLVGLTACGSSDATTPTYDDPYQLFSGLITERLPTGILPSEGAWVHALVKPGGLAADYVTHARTDREGRYALARVPRGAVVQLWVVKPGFVHQCAAPPLTVSGSVVFNREIVVRGLAISSPASVMSAAGFRTISGVIRRGPNHVPEADLFVAYEPDPELYVASTYSDRDGRYALCGVPQDKKVVIAAYRGEDPNADWFEVPAGGSTDRADFDIP